MSHENKSAPASDELEMEGVDIDRLGPPEMPFVKYEDYGPEKWPTRAGTYVSATGGRDPFVDVRNPRESVCVVHLNLGCDAALHVALERLRPKADQLSDGEMRGLLARMAPIRPQYVRVKITWQPGETVRIPRELLPGLRVIRDGFVVSGAAPFLEVVGEKNPQIHPAIIPADSEPVPAPQRRRNAK